MIRQPRILAILLTALVFWAALPFGSVTTNFRFGLFLAVGLLLLLSAWTLEPRSVEIPRGAVAGLISFALLGVVQAVPLPRSLLEVVSPARVALAEAVSELADQVGLSTGSSGLALSVAPWNTLQTSLFVAVMAAVLVVAARAGREREQRRLLMLGVVGAGVFQVLYGGGRFATGGGRIWGQEVAEVSGRVRGTFVNPDHFAFFLGLVLPVVFAWGWWAFKRAHRIRIPVTYLALLGPPLIIWVMLFVGLTLSGSRAGLLCALTTVAAQGMLVATRGRSLRLAPLFLMVLAVGLSIGAVLYIGQAAEGGIPKDSVGRLAQTSAYEIRWNTRLVVWSATLDLIKDYPWFGVGLGTFREIFPLVQPADLSGTWWHAHSDILEILLTAGVLGFIIVLVGYGTLVRRLTRVWRQGPRSEDRSAGLAALGTLLAATLHSCFDFGLTMPANALLLSAVCGACAATSLSRPSRKQRPAAERGRPPGKPRERGGRERAAWEDRSERI